MVYLYDGQKIIETRDGSGNLYQQFIHGTQYIDELVMMRVKGKGDLYVHQDANWNVIGLTDLGGHLVERYVLSPYGEVTVYQETGYGDYDEDYDVMGDPPSTSDPDYTAFTGACAGSGPTGACRILDLDFDGDVDTTDRDDHFMSLPHGLMRHPGRIATAVHQPFGHQGLLYEPELASYQNRARQYDPGKRRFVQRDPYDVTHGDGSAYQDGMNSYVYVRGRPLSSRDPSGRQVIEGEECEGGFPYCPETRLRHKNGLQASGTRVETGLREALNAHRALGLPGTVGKFPSAQATPPGDSSNEATRQDALDMRPGHPWRRSLLVGR